MSIKDFLNKVEQAVLKEMDEVEEKWTEFCDEMKPVPSFRERFEARMNIISIKENSKGRRHKPQKKIRRR